MKLNTEKNILLCQKALYSKQLEAYSGLCKLYARLAERHPDYTSGEIENRYAEALTNASKGDLKFLNYSRL